MPECAAIDFPSVAQCDSSSSIATAVILQCASSLESFITFTRKGVDSSMEANILTVHVPDHVREICAMSCPPTTV